MNYLSGPSAGLRPLVDEGNKISGVYADIGWIMTCFIRNRQDTIHPHVQSQEAAAIRPLFPDTFLRSEFQGVNMPYNNMG
jgi:hypothetical protein